MKYNDVDGQDRFFSRTRGRHITHHMPPKLSASSLRHVYLCLGLIGQFQISPALGRARGTDGEE